MTIPQNPAGRLAEFFKTTRKDTSADILVNSGIKEIKKGNNKGEMVPSPPTGFRWPLSKATVMLNST